MCPENFHRLLIYRSDADRFEEILSKELPALQIHSARKPLEAVPFIEKAEIILSSSWQITDELLAKAKRLAWFASSSAGNERLVSNPNLPGTVILTKTIGYGERMAEYVFAYLLYFNKRIAENFDHQRNKIWDRRWFELHPGGLRGQTLGILGLGSIGREIAKRGKQFGMNVIGLKRVPEPVESVDRVFGADGLREMIPHADHLVVVLPLTPETHSFLGEGELRLMRDGATLISIGRGKEIDQEALIRVLKSKRITAVLDVFEKEPLPKESELWDLENVMITPHISGADMPAEICKEFVDNYRRWMKGEPLVGVVARDKGY
jgi:glyoxylate/hydroxypyruvate reductase